MTATTANTNPPAPVSAPPSARILLVEDSEHDRRFFSRLLEKSEEPYEVVYSHDGEAALELLKHQKFDLLISDLNMPGMDGIELIRQAQPYLGDSGALILTGSRDVHSAAEAVRLRIMDYILKEPRDALRENLLPQIAGALKQIRLMRENKRLERELRLRLAHLEQIHQQMPEALFATLDNAHKVIEINEQARDLLGLGPDAPLAGRKITELLASLSEGLADSVDDLCAKQQEARNLYIEAVSPDKPPRLFTLSLKLLDPKMMAGNGDLPSSILSLRDITPAESGRPAKEEAIFHGIVGRDPAILEICHLVRQVAPLPTSVLITGPTGSGK
ncbi:response regulator, partial [Candidatus Sumerlaeota bacterium]|nr:response regulator [Candidatus Sumerlaeota bacterium]